MRQKPWLIITRIPWFLRLKHNIYLVPTITTIPVLIQYLLPHSDRLFRPTKFSFFIHQDFIFRIPQNHVSFEITIHRGIHYIGVIFAFFLACDAWDSVPLAEGGDWYGGGGDFLPTWVPALILEAVEALEVDSFLADFAYFPEDNLAVHAGSEHDWEGPEEEDAGDFNCVAEEVS